MGSKIVLCHVFSHQKYPWEVLMIIFVDIEYISVIYHEFLTAEYLVFWTTVPLTRDYYSMPKLREFVHTEQK